jgi:hypothetical protein
LEIQSLAVQYVSLGVNKIILLIYFKRVAGALTSGRSFNKLVSKTLTLSALYPRKAVVFLTMARTRDM